MFLLFKEKKRIVINNMGNEYKINTRALNPDLAIRRVINNIQNDFIYAPHISIIYYFAAEELWNRLEKKLTDSSFEPCLPITTEVPKVSGFCRPGSILLPSDRLIYQLLIDSIAPTAEKALDRNKVFSNVLLEQDPDGFMFEPSGECYTNYNIQTRSLCTERDLNYVLSADISCYFERLNHHVLINALESDGCDSHSIHFLEKILSIFAQKNSFGIIQGCFPSDFLGNYYLSIIDGHHAIQDIPFTRYMDDMSVFFKTERDAKKHLINLSNHLRKEGLSLNESKTSIKPVTKFIHKETEIERLFEEAKIELQPNFDRGDFYDSTIMWDFLEETAQNTSEEEVNLEATKHLFKQKADIKIRAKIDKFCLPVFTAASNDYALDYVLENYAMYPHMAQIFSKYLKDMVTAGNDIVARIEAILDDPSVVYDYQIMWLLASLLSAHGISQKTIQSTLKILMDAGRNQSLRAVCAIFIGSHGSAANKRILRNHYDNESSVFVQAAILYSAKFFPTSERNTCFRAWGGLSELNSLIVTALRKSNL